MTSTDSLFSLAGKTALVTGASRGIGRSIATALAEAGADVALVARGDLSETATAVEAAGRRALRLNQDLADKTVLPRLVTATVEAFGQLDILVNNAGIIRRAPFLEFTEADWDAVMDLNLKHVFLLSQEAARHMVPRGSGKIIHIASMLSYQGGILVPSYTASKHAVMGLTRLMANELAGKGIHVNAIAPGYIATEATQALQDDPVRNQAILARIPAGRWGHPDDLRGAAVFLASEASNYLHGFTLAVDGGWLAR